MSLVGDMLSALYEFGDYPTLYARLRRYNSSRHDKSSLSSDNTLRVTLSRLKQKGFVKNESGKWKITNSGSAYLKNLKRKVKFSNGNFKKTSSGLKNLIIIYDIPEDEKYKRKLLRSALIDLNFEIVQKSVWIGPSPLPEEFIVFLHDSKLLEYLKFFEASEKDII